MYSALCLSGNFRDYSKTLKSLIEFINSFDKCDVFMIYDKNEKKEDIFKMIQSLNPVSVKAVDSLDVCNNLNMWYKIKESYLIYEEYAIKNEINYDIVIRSRYDLILSNNFDFNKLIIKENTLYIGEIKDYLFRVIQKITYATKKFLLDEFFFGKPELVKNYFLFYDSIIKSENKCLEKRLGELDFQSYSELLGTNVERIKFYYVMYQWRDDFIGYTKKKWKNHPSFVKSSFINLNLIMPFIIIILIIFNFILMKKINSLKDKI